MFFILLLILFMSKDLFKTLADKYDRQKMRKNDLIRISNIHKKVNQSVSMLKNKPISIDLDSVKPNSTVYNFEQSKTSKNEIKKILG